MGGLLSVSEQDKTLAALLKNGTTKLTKADIYDSSKRAYLASRKIGNRFGNLNIVASLFPQAVTTDSYFVEYAKVAGENSAPIDDLLRKHEDTNVSIIGEGGIGKTTYLIKLLERIFNDRSENVVPIFIELNRCPAQIGSWVSEMTGVSNFIIRYIAAQTINTELESVPSTVISQIAEMFNMEYESKQTYLLLLDGFNEINHSKACDASGVAIGSTIRQLLIKEIQFLMNCSNVRVILTSRKIDMVYFNERAVNIELVGLKREAITDYLRQRQFDIITINTVQSNYSLMDCLRIPLFLCMFAANARNGERFSPETRGEILFSFFNSQRSLYNEVSNAERLNFKSNIHKMEVTFILDFILPYIGWQMQRTEKFSSSNAEIKKYISYLLNDELECGSFWTSDVVAFPFYQSESQEINDIRNLLLTRNEIEIIECCVSTLSIMYRDERHCCSFIHHHIRDYFAGLFEIQWLRLSNAHFDEYKRCKQVEHLKRSRGALSHIDDRIWSYEECLFIGEILSEQKNRPVYTNGLWKNPSGLLGKEQLLIKSALDVFRESKSIVNYGVMNAIEILKAVRRNLAGENFSKLDLSKCCLYETNCSIGVFPTSLTANFSGCKISDTTFKQQGHSDGITGYRYVESGEFLVTVSIDGTAKKWDVSTGICLSTVEIPLITADSHNPALIGLDFANNGSSFTAIIIYDEDEGENDEDLGEEYEDDNVEIDNRKYAIEEYIFDGSPNRLSQGTYASEEGAHMRVRYSADSNLICILNGNTFCIYRQGDHQVTNEITVQAGSILDYALTDEAIFVMFVIDSASENNVSNELSYCINEIIIETGETRNLHVARAIVEEYESGKYVIDDMLFLLHHRKNKIFFTLPLTEKLLTLNIETGVADKTVLDCANISTCTLAVNDDNILFAITATKHLPDVVVIYNIDDDVVETAYQNGGAYFYEEGNQLREKLLVFDNEFSQPMEWDMQQDKYVSKYLFGGVNISCALLSEDGSDILFLFQNDCLYTVDAVSMKYKYGLYLGEADAIIRLYAFDYRHNILWLFFESTNREKEYVKYYNLEDMTSECLYYEMTDEHCVNTIYTSCNLDALFLATDKEIVMLSRREKRSAIVYRMQESERALEITYDDKDDCLIAVMCYRIDDGDGIVCPKVKKFTISEDSIWSLCAWYNVPIIDESELSDFVRFRDISQMKAYTAEFKLKNHFIFSGIFYAAPSDFAHKLNVLELRITQTGDEVCEEVALLQSDVNYYLIRMSEETKEQIESISSRELIEFDDKTATIVTLDSEENLSVAIFKDGSYHIKAQHSIADLGIDCVDGILSPHGILYYWGDNVERSSGRQYENLIYAFDYSSGQNHELKWYDPGVIINSCDFSKAIATSSVMSFLKEHGAVGV